MESEFGEQKSWFVVSDIGPSVLGARYATLCVRENPGCLFIATNCDAVTHLTDAQEWAGGGSMVGAIKGSTKKEPTVVGKPSTFMLDYLAEKYVLTLMKFYLDKHFKSISSL